ncbi:MAG: glycosyltransferase family 39 protein [Rhizobiales bacterium]|nr:glycosyltransferase family 39 protein [Hyphomicrobiales bacterium]
MAIQTAGPEISYRIPDRMDRITASRARSAIVLVVLALLAFLPGFFQIPPIDRDEARYAQATRQMMETGNYLDIRFQETPRYLQPVGIYWLQAAAAKITGFDARAPIWVHRLPSLLGAIAAVGLTYWAMLAIVGSTGAFIAALFMASSVLLGMEARLAKTDAVLLATTIGAMGVLARAYLGQALSSATAMMFWVALAAGMLVKGPLILLVVGSTTLALLAWDRSLAWFKALRPKLGIWLFLALILPWFVAIAIVSGGEFFITAIGHSMLGKVAAGQQGHGFPPGYYLLLFWLTFAPAALFTIVAAPWVWKNRNEPAVRFCLAWIIPTWIIFELIVTKLPHYVLPTYPAIAGLIALAMLNGRQLGPLLAWTLVAGAVLLVAAIAAALYVVAGTVSIAAIAVSLAAVAILAWGVQRRQSISPATFAATIAIGAIMVQGAALGLVAPKMDNLWLSPRLAAAVARNAPCGTPQVVSADYHQPSLVFMVGTNTILGFPPDAAKFLASGGCRLALITERSEQAFLAELAKLGRTAELAERVNGMNLGKFGRESVGVYRLRAS